MHRGGRGTRCRRASRPEGSARRDPRVSDRSRPPWWSVWARCRRVPRDAAGRTPIPSPTAAAAAVAGGAATIGGPFTLEDGDGAAVTDAEAITGPTLVYFGYSFCPDVCPTDLSRNALAAADAGGARGPRSARSSSRSTRSATRRRWCATSPRRSTPAIVGLTGTPDEVAAAAKAYKVYYRKAGDDPDYYLMDHSTFTYLMAPRTGSWNSSPRRRPRAGGRVGGLLCRPSLIARGRRHRDGRCSPEELGPDRSLLILDDDEPFLRRLGRAMEKRGFEVTAVDSVAGGAARRGEPRRRPIAVRRPAARGRQRPRGGRALRERAARRADRGADRLRRHRLGGGGGEDRRDRLSGEARRRQRRDRARCSRPTPAQPAAAGESDVAPTGCAGSISSASTSSATTTSRRPRGGSTCTAAPCSGSWPSAARSGPEIDCQPPAARVAARCAAFPCVRSATFTGLAGCQPSGVGQVSGNPRNTTYDRLNSLELHARRRFSMPPAW